MTGPRNRRKANLDIAVRIGVPLILGLLTFVVLRSVDRTVSDSLVLAATVIAVALIAQLVVDVDLLHGRVQDGFTQLDESARLSRLVERSALDSELLNDFVRTTSWIDNRVPPLLQKLARREVERVSLFARQLSVGAEVTYDGEDREWLLGLTLLAQRSIDAISLSTVDAGISGFDGGLWTSDLGARYLELQREAIDLRGIVIRRIFVFDHEDLARDETFQRITSMQREVGVEVRMLDQRLIPDRLKMMIFDFIIFDGVLSYEMTPATTFALGNTRPAIVRTLLAPAEERVRDRSNRFEALWRAADPERRISA